MSSKQMRNAARKINVSSSSLDTFVTGDDYKNEMSAEYLRSLSLDELASSYGSIERQAHLYQGRILLEARRRFPSDKEYGEWIIEKGLDSSSQQYRSKLLNLARFFETEDRTLDGINITSAYELTSPQYASIAEEVYREIKGKNLMATQVREILAKKFEPYVEKMSQSLAIDRTPREFKKEEEQETGSVSFVDLLKAQNPNHPAVIEHEQRDSVFDAPFKSEVDPATMSYEEQILYSVLGGMDNEKKLLILENCKDIIIDLKTL